MLPRCRIAGDAPVAPRLPLPPVPRPQRTPRTSPLPRVEVRPHPHRHPSDAPIRQRQVSRRRAPLPPCCPSVQQEFAHRVLPDAHLCCYLRDGDNSVGVHPHVRHLVPDARAIMLRGSHATTMSGTARQAATNSRPSRVARYARTSSADSLPTPAHLRHSPDRAMKRGHSLPPHSEHWITGDGKRPRGAR